jgi:flagellar protein FlaJ
MDGDRPKQSFIKTLIITGQMTRLIIYITTGISVSVFTILAVMRYSGVLGDFYFSWSDFTVFAILSGTGIYGIYQYLHLRRVYKIDCIFPDFVRDLAESRRAGMTFTKAVMFSAKGNYGMLTEEINKIAQQISWGSSIDEALTAFAQRVNTKSIRRTVSLIIEASKSGGNVADVLDAASRDAREMKLLESERRSNMQSYVVVIYVGMFVFLTIIVILVHQFLPAISDASAGSMGQGIGSGMGQVGAKDVLPIFFWATIMQGLGSGLVAGAFEEGSLVSGVKHIFIILIITWVIFKFLVGI